MSEHVRAGAGSAPHREQNLLDRLSRRQTLERHYSQMERRERAIIAHVGAIGGGRVLSVGCGWHPGRHLFASPAFQLVGVDADPERVAAVLATGRADEAFVGAAGSLRFPDQSFDAILYRLVLHHLADQGPLEPIFAEAARLLGPGGLLVAIEPGLWHPVGAALAIANRVGLATALHGTPDDIPLSPRRLVRAAVGAGLHPQLHAVTYSWRRLPQRLQSALGALDELGSRPRLAPFGHTLMLLARKLEQR